MSFIFMCVAQYLLLVACLRSLFYFYIFLLSQPSFIEKLKEEYVTVSLHILILVFSVGMFLGEEFLGVP